MAMSEDIYGPLRDQLLETVRSRGGARSAAVAEALLTVPRHLFLPELDPVLTYRDDAIVTQRDADGVPTSSSSQPTIMAIMLDQLDLRPGHRVLEIGAGTGYNAALMAHLVGPTGTVISLDIDPDTVARARGALAAAGRGEVIVVHTDGAEGYPPAAPFDRIIATVGVWDLAPAWTDQLHPEGRLVVPLDLRGPQVSAAFEREDGRWVSRSLVHCGFMRLRGAMAGPDRPITLDATSRLRLSLPVARPVDAARLVRAMSVAAVVRTTGVMIADTRTVALWLGIVDPRAVGLSDEGDGSAAMAAALTQDSGYRMTSALLEDDTIALVARRPVADGYAVDVHGYGPAADRLSDELADALRRWDQAGQPDADQMAVTAFIDEEPIGGEVIEKTYTRLAVAISPAASA